MSNSPDFNQLRNAYLDLIGAEQELVGTLESHFMPRLVRLQKVAYSVLRKSVHVDAPAGEVLREDLRWITCQFTKPKSVKVSTESIEVEFSSNSGKATEAFIEKRFLHMSDRDFAALVRIDALRYRVARSKREAEEQKQKAAELHSQYEEAIRASESAKQNHERLTQQTIDYVNKLALAHVKMERRSKEREKNQRS